MRFDRVRLLNFKCYDEADLRLEQGVTVIHGLNGSGKSSLLESCFFALYGARALESTLEEVVTIGADEARVELWFTHDGTDYRVERELRLRGDGAQTTTCVLETPDGTVEGARDVRAAVAELLRMDESAFVNCAYVRQGEVNKLINAAPGDRQDMIDDLLQLGKLEVYRERASDARVGVGRVRDGKAGALEDLGDQIERKEAKDLHERLDGLRSELSETTAEIERYEENREEAETERDEAETVLEEYEERRRELESVRSDVEDLTNAIAEAERERSVAADRVSELRERADDLRKAVTELLAETDLDAGDAAALDDDAVADRLAVLRGQRDDLAERIREQSVEVQKHVDAAETARERAEELEDDAAERRESAAEIDTEVADARADLEDQRERLTSLAEEVEAARVAFDDAPVEPDGAADHLEAVADRRSDLREEIAAVEADLENARESVAEAERLLAEGKCPECGQPIDDSPHVDSVDEDRERVADLEDRLGSLGDELADVDSDLERADELVAAAERIEELRSERETLARLVEERAASLDERTERAETLRERAEELEADAADEREAAAAAESEAEAARATMGELNAESSDLKAAVDTLETLADRYEALTETKDEMESLREERSNLAEQNELRRERLAEKREKKAELETAVEESAVESARERKETAERYLEEVESELAALAERRDELQSAVGAVEQELSDLASLRERREELQATVADLESLYEEAAELESMYADLRAELRQRNVSTLERMLNETFNLVYGNDAYSHIELDGEYELTVYQKDGEALDPEQLSGGERAIFNLSLRCAIYRLLAEGIEGAAPMPPLILDEPTVFLDAGHVSKLVDLVESMRSLGVEQIVVVSHDDELVGAAETLVTVSKDPTTNRSTVERADAADPTAPSVS